MRNLLKQFDEETLVVIKDDKRTWESYHEIKEIQEKKLFQHGGEYQTEYYDGEPAYDKVVVVIK